MRIFLDTSVVLAACGSELGASREIFRLAMANDWELISTPFVVNEVEQNLPGLASAHAQEAWGKFRALLVIRDNVFVADRPAVFEPAKDRPILFSALAWSDVLLTLDQQDFGTLFDNPFYGLIIMRPGNFLITERAAGRLRQ